MSFSRHKTGVQRLLLWAATLAVLAGLVAQPLHAASPRQATSNNPNDTSYHVSCRGGECTVGFDLGEIELESVVPKDMPVKLDVPAGVVPFLPQGSASIEISDRVKLTLPWGSLELREGDFSLHLDENGKLDRLSGKADEIVPSLNLGPNLKLGGPFSAAIGYDLGATLDNLSTVLDPERRYLFLDLGSGFSISATTPGGAGNAPLQLSVPQNDRISLVIDPQGKLMYVDGRLTLYQMADLGLVMSLLGGNIPANLPLLNGVVLPTRTTVGIGALLSGDMSKNFIQITGGMGLNGGPLAKLLRVEGEPLGFDGTLRVDANGLLLGGVAGSSLNPNQLLESKGELSIYIPFGGGELPYVRTGGRLAVPIAGIVAEGSQQLGGGALSEDMSTNALLESTADAARSWWNKTGSWMSNIASGTAAVTGVTLNAMQQAADGTADAISGGAVTAWNRAGSAAGAVGGAAANAGGAIKDAAGAAGSAVGGAASGAAGAVGGAAAAAGGAIKDAAGAAAGAAGAAGSAVGNAAGAAGSAVGGAVGGAAAGTGQTAAQAWERTVDATACAAAQARRLWCETTGFCPVEEVVCGDE